MTDELIRRGTYTETEGRWPCEGGGRDGVMLPQAKKDQHPSEAERERETFFFRDVRGCMALVMT